MAPSRVPTHAAGHHRGLGTAFFVEALVRIGLALLLPVSVLVVLSNALPIAVIAVLVWWTIAYGKRARAAAGTPRTTDP